MLRTILATICFVTTLAPAPSLSQVFSQQEKQKISERLPLELVASIYNAEEKYLIDSGEAAKICKIGKETNSAGIPLFLITSLSEMHKEYEKEDISSLGTLAPLLKKVVANIKLSAFIKTITSTCPSVF